MDGWVDLWLRPDERIGMRMKGWLLLALLSADVSAGDHQPGSDPQKYDVDEYLTCAVYYRMLIGALKVNKSDLSSLEDVYMDRMNKAIQAGRKAAIAEWGAADADKEFDQEWKIIYGEMSADIDRNFTRIRILKMKYADRCDQMGESRDKPIKITAAPALHLSFDLASKPFRALASSK